MSILTVELLKAAHQDKATSLVQVIHVGHQAGRVLATRKLEPRSDHKDIPAALYMTRFQTTW